MICEAVIYLYPAASCVNEGGVAGSCYFRSDRRDYDAQNLDFPPKFIQNAGGGATSSRFCILGRQFSSKQKTFWQFSDGPKFRGLIASLPFFGHDATIYISIKLQSIIGLFVAIVDEKKEKNMASIAAAKTKVRADIQQLSDQLKSCKDEIAKFKQHMLQLEASNSLPTVGS